MEDHQSHTVSTKTNVVIWISLLILTFLSVEASFAEFRWFAVGVALFIASAKALIVSIYFMHLKFDNKILAIMVAVTVLVFLTFIILTFFDYGFREPIV